MPIPLPALLLVLVSSLAWSGTDVCRKLVADRVRPFPLAFLFTAAAVPLFAAWTAFDGFPAVAAGYALPALASVALNVAANLFFFMALRSSTLSSTIPLLSLTPVFTALLGIPMLGEVPTERQWLGIVFVVAGAFVLNLPASGAAAPRSPVSGLDRGALLMVLVALLWSLTVPLDKIATARASGPFHGMILCAGVAAAVLAVLAVRGRLGELADVRNARWAFGGGLLTSILALGLQLMAIQEVWIGLMETLKRGIGNLSALVFGRLLFGETVTPRKLLAVGLMVAGVALLFG